MARGSKIIPLRVPDDLMAQLTETIKRVNKIRTDEPFDMSSFIRTALREKLAHYKRSSRKGNGHASVSRQPEEVEADRPIEVTGQEATDMAGQP